MFSHSEFMTVKMICKSWCLSKDDNVNASSPWKFQKQTEAQKPQPCAFCFLESFRKAFRHAQKLSKREGKRRKPFMKAFCIDKQVEFVWPYTTFFFQHLTNFSFLPHFVVTSREKCCHSAEGEFIFSFWCLINMRQRALMLLHVISECHLESNETQK